MLGIILAILYTALFIYIIRKHSFFHSEQITKNWFTFAFIVKLFAGFLLWFVYTLIYPDRTQADIFKYFDDGNAIYKALFENPIDYFKILLGSTDPSLQHYIDQTGYWERTFNQGIYNETRTVIRFNAIVSLFSFGNYHVHTVFMCFVSFIGLTGIFKTFLPFLSGKKKELFAIVFLLPSVLFWGSGVLKEGLILFAEGMIFYHWFKLMEEGFSVRRSIFLMLFIGLLSITKLYMLGILLAALIIYAAIKYAKQKSLFIKITLSILLLLPSGLILSKMDLPFMLMEKQLHSYFMARGGSYLGLIEKQKFIYIHPSIENRITYLKDKPGYCKINTGVPYIAWFQEARRDTEFVNSSADTTTYWVYYSQGPAGSFIKPSLLEPTYLSLIANSPLAFITTAFRPHIFEIKNPLMLLSAVENACIIALILLCAFYLTSPLHYKQMIFLCFFISASLFILIGLTTPILGAAVRYKIPALPFFLIGFLFLLDKEKLIHRIPFLKKIIG